MTGSGSGSIKDKRRMSDPHSAGKKPKKKGSQKKRDSLPLTKEKKAAAALEGLRNRKPEANTLNAEASVPSSRKDSIDVLKIQQEKRLAQKNKKPKLSKRKSLGEALSLKLPQSLVIRRNSIDAFSLKNIFSSSRKNSLDDVRDSDDEIKVPKNNRVNQLKVGSVDLRRRHSHGAADIRAGTTHVYKPVSRPRTRLASHGFQKEAGAGNSNTLSSHSYDDYSSQRNKLGRRGSGPVVVVSPASGSSSARGSSECASSSDVSESWSHSDITDLDGSEDHTGSSLSEDDDGAFYGSAGKHSIYGKGPSLGHKLRYPRGSVSANNSRPCSTTEDDESYESESMLSSDEDEEASLEIPQPKSKAQEKPRQQEMHEKPEVKEDSPEQP